MVLAAEVRLCVPLAEPHRPCAVLKTSHVRALVVAVQSGDVAYLRELLDKGGQVPYIASIAAIAWQEQPGPPPSHAPLHHALPITRHP